MNKNKKLILIGKILKAHGLKGLLTLKSYTQNPKDIFKYTPLHNENQTKKYNIKLKNNKKIDTFVVEINNITSKEEADKLVNTDLYIERKKLPKPKTGEFYYEDLIGLKVLTDKNKKGIILKVADFGAGSMIEVKWNNGEEETIPFNNDFIKEINLKEEYIKVNLPVYI